MKENSPVRKLESDLSYFRQPANSARLETIAASHPLFVPLHAHLFGAGELLHSGVSEHRLLSLYPFELGLYRSFFIDFFQRHPQKLTGRSNLVELAESYRLLREFLEPVEKRIALGIYTDDQYDAYRKIANEELPQLARKLAAEIAGSSQPEFFTALTYQLGFFGRVMSLLNDFPAAEFEDDVAALGYTTRHMFFVGFEKLLAYYGVRIYFGTEERRLNAIRTRELRGNGEPEQAQAAY